MPQDAVIPPQAVVDGAHQVVALPVQAVMVGIPTVIRTEFLVGTASEFGSAFQTAPFQDAVLFDLNLIVPGQPRQDIQGNARPSKPVLFRIGPKAVSRGNAASLKPLFPASRPEGRPGG